MVQATQIGCPYKTNMQSYIKDGLNCGTYYKSLQLMEYWDNKFLQYYLQSRSIPSIANGNEERIIVTMILRNILCLYYHLTWDLRSNIDSPSLSRTPTGKGFYLDTVLISEVKWENYHSTVLRTFSQPASWWRWQKYQQQWQREPTTHFSLFFFVFSEI